MAYKDKQKQLDYNRIYQQTHKLELAEYRRIHRLEYVAYRQSHREEMIILIQVWVFR